MSTDRAVKYKRTANWNEPPNRSSSNIELVNPRIQHLEPNAVGIYSKIMVLKP